MPRRILFVDNDQDFLNTRGEFLEREGFEVFRALTIAEAMWLLENMNIHLAIIDVRMENDNDPRDASGLRILESYPSVAKIVLTEHPNADTARLSLRRQVIGGRYAIDYLKKEDPPESFVMAVYDVFDQYIHINWNLVIDGNSRDPFALVNRIEQDLENERLLSRAEELKDLFRGLFHNKDHIRVERLLWQRDERVALIVFAFKEGVKPESFVVVCGRNAIVNQETQRFDEFAPKAAGDTGTTLSEKMRAETTHFAANAYTLTGNNLENVQTLAELYQIGPEKTFNIALSIFYQETLRAWHQDKPVHPKEDTPNGLYRQRLRLKDDPQYFHERVKVIEAQIPVLGIRIERTDESIAVHFKQTATYPDPIPLLLRLIRLEQPDLLLTVPGVLSGENVLTDPNGRAWLTDFAEAGSAPLLWNYVNLEAAIRFDWVDTKELQWRHELERCIIFGDFARLDVSVLEPVLRKPGRAINMIRKLAMWAVGKNELDYHLGIFFHAARRLADFNPAYPLTDTERARLGHILISMAMLAKKMGENRDNVHESTPAQGEGLRVLDLTARRIQAGNREIKLTSQEFGLFYYLFQNANRVCTKEELVEKVFKNEYNEKYLHTLVGRIRRALRDDPHQPKFLFTEAGIGYRLNKTG